MSLPFEDRAEAGRLLAERLVPLGLRRPLILALPRGGVPVAFEIARRLSGDDEADLDVLVTRKIGYPYQPELGVGAIAEGGEPVFDRALLRRLGLTTADLADTVRRERAELDRRVAVYRGGRPPPPVEGRCTVVVDDGLATGGTARAALRAVRARGPARLVLAVPVGAARTERAMRAEADDVVVFAVPSSFHAVGQCYRHFEQLTDDDVISWLTRPRSRTRPGPREPGPA